MRRVVPLAQEGVALRGGQNVEAANRELGRRNGCLQQTNKPLPSASTFARLKQVALDSRAAAAGARPGLPSGSSG